MAVPSDLDSQLSARPIVLWVEDRIAKEYIYKIWSPDDKNINILIGGGKDTIFGIVHDLRHDGNEHVFGLVDRDFGNSNQGRWSNRDINVFIPNFFEMENYLLSWPALAGCRENRLQRSETDIQQQGESLAQGMTAWMACCQVLSDYHNRLVGDYSDHPAIDAINDLTKAENYIKGQDWYRNFQTRANGVGNDSALSSDLSSAHSDQLKNASSDHWVQNFSGKEIFRRIRGQYFSQSRTDIDLAMAVADWQVENYQVPADLIMLRDTLKNRVGLPS